MKYVLVLFIFLSGISAQAESWKVATLEWPPYMCSQCYRNGAAANALRSALAKRGITVEFVFSPWVQAQKNGGQRSFVGYFPAWKEEVLPGFQPSQALFASPVGFLQRKDKPLIWNQLSDLKGKTFAVTQGYGNTAEFNKLSETGVFKTVTFLNEESTVRRLALGVVDGVLMDRFVAEHYLQNTFAKHKEKLVFNPKTIETKNLYLAFNESSLEKRKVLEEILNDKEFQQAVEEYLRQVKSFAAGR